MMLPLLEINTTEVILLVSVAKHSTRLF